MAIDGEASAGSVPVSPGEVSTTVTVFVRFAFR